jgi:hypothetical protein
MFLGVDRLRGITLLVRLGKGMAAASIDGVDTIRLRSSAQVRGYTRTVRPRTSSLNTLPRCS